jgi:DNA (cytosine-5)-methyltransferase 1
MRTVAFCEIEPYPRAVLAERWPGVPIYGDVRELTAERLAADGIAADLICGGFPCQDISIAGKGAGLGGERSGLWSEYRRLIEECRPSWVVIENVSALRSRGLDQVLGEVAALGYDAEWHCIPASAVGAPHQRDRIWIVAYPNSRYRDRRGWVLEVGRVTLKGQVANDGDTKRVQWSAEPGVGRVAYGVPSRLERLRALGNALVPQIPEIIGRAILEAESK